MARKATSRKAAKKPAKKPAKSKSKAKAKRAQKPAAKARALHRAAVHHNWDDGLEGLRRILANRACDLGTALAIYWMGAPGFDQQFATEKDLEDPRYRWRSEVFVFLRKLEERIIKHDFATAKILFNPRFDRTTLNSSGHDWTAEYATVKVVRPIPDALKEPSCADPAWTARGKAPIVNTAMRLT
jgi:hypothetical protein